MHIGPTLFDAINPPMVQVTLQCPFPAEAEDRVVDVRLRAPGEKSIHASFPVSRYSPEHSILLAVAESIRAMETLQVHVTPQKLREHLDQAALLYVDPF